MMLSPSNNNLFTTQVINDLKLHLSWDLGLRVFYLNREQLGTRIIVRFQQLGILLFMKKIIIDDNKIVS